MPHIFISYAKNDTRRLALRLRDTLSAIPTITVWMDEILAPAESWARQIEQQIDKSDYVIVLLSPDVNRASGPKQRRSFVLNEIDYALQEHKLIIPVLAQKSRMPVQLAGVQYIDLTGDESRGIDRLVQFIRTLAAIPDDSSSLLSAQKNKDVRLSPWPRKIRKLWPVAIAVLIVGGVFAPLAIRYLDSQSPPPINTRTPTDTATEPASLTPDSTTPTSDDTVADIPSVVSIPTNAGSPFLGITLPIVSSNDQWAPVWRSFDNVDLVLVPYGCFQMGGDQADEAKHERCLTEPFFIDRYEVTNAQFDARNGVAERTSFHEEPNRPRDRVTWFEAREFCQLRGMRLPTEEEWEYAARGPNSLEYPWGDTYVAANITEVIDTLDPTANIGSKPNDLSWVGAYDMVGNVHEWTNTLFRPYPYTTSDDREDVTNMRDPRVVRGNGSTNGRISVSASTADPRLGFRCAASLNDSNRVAMFAMLQELTQFDNDRARATIDTIGQ